MSIRRLQTLIAVAETSSFAEAAERVHLTPAAVGQQMKSLESEIGSPLFERKQRSPTLNQLGRSLLPKAKDLILSYQSLLSSASGEFHQERELTIGAVDTVMSGLLPRVLTRLREHYEGFHLRIIPGLSSELLAQVDRGSIDAAIISQPRQLYSYFDWWPIASEPLVLIAPESVETESPEELLKHWPFIRFNRNAWVGQQIDQWLIKSKIKVREVMELTTLDAISTMVASELGVSIVPDNCVPPSRQLPIKRILLEGNATVRVLGVLSRNDHVDTGAVKILVDELMNVVEKGVIK